MDAERLLEAALRLPADARAKLAGELLSSLDDSEVEPGRDEAWAIEISRRLKEVDSGEATLIPGDEFLNRLGAAAGGRRP